jgi:hypothetical protein
MFRKDGYSDDVFRIHHIHELTLDGTLVSDGLYENSYLDLQVPQHTKDYFQTLETKVAQELFKSRYPLVNGITQEGVVRTKFVTRYGHILAPLIDADGARLNKYHLRKGDGVCVRIQPTSAWRNDHACGISWVIRSLIKRESPADKENVVAPLRLPRPLDGVEDC